MFAIRSLNLKVLGLAAAIVAADNSAIAGPPPKGGNGGSNGHSIPSGGGNGMKVQGGGAGSVLKATGGTPTGMNNGPKGNGGMPGNGGISPGKGNGMPGGMGQGNKGQGQGQGQGGMGQGQGKGNGMPGGMGQGQGKGQGGMGQGNKPWMQKPSNGQNTIYCKTKCDPYYFQKCGIKNSYGYCYKGFDHNHWYCRQYSPNYGCWFFYDQGCSNWYYWCEQDVCYYPCSYRPYKTYCVTPVVTTVQVPYTYTVPIVTKVPVTTYQEVVTYETRTGYKTVQTTETYPTGDYANVGYQTAGGPFAQQGPAGPPADAGQVNLPALPQ